ncbi:helix-loop-helix protein delilah-like [Bacillus rossius redtenbacheri]|uniref:helix-loop-helix protein delilah-like n=1 Tax=Bacillus rossius redtenbacheri TaxID=93214 RepID=UPI002FDEEA74
MNTLMQRMVGEVGLSAPQRLPMSPIPMLLQQPEPAMTKDVTDSNNNSNESATSSGDSVQSDDGASRAAEKYSLRPRSLQKRFEVEQKTRVVEKTTTRRSSGGGGGGGGGRPKQKPPPLSKYRRKTANARERDRMREINAAFESLRRAVPHSPADACPQGEKLTKITTLRLAMRYISALSQALQQEDHAATPRSFDLADLLSDDGGDAPDLDALLLESDAESLNFQSDLSEHCLTPPDFSDHSLTPADLGARFADEALAPADFGEPGACFGDHCLVP